MKANDKIKSVANKMWSVHPRTIQDMGITRQQYYERQLKILSLEIQADLLDLLFKSYGDKPFLPEHVVDDFRKRLREYND